MPLLVKQIDEIAREKNRDVLFVHFEEYDHEHQENNHARNALFEWLDLQNIEYFPCMGLAGEALLVSYSGDIYVDVPFDVNNPAFRTLSEYLEDEQGNMKIDGVLFYSLSLELALEIEADRANDEFDDEGFEIEYDEDEFGDQFGEGFVENIDSRPEDLSKRSLKKTNDDADDQLDDGPIGTIQ